MFMWNASIEKHTAENNKFNGEHGMELKFTKEFHPTKSSCHVQKIFFLFSWNLQFTVMNIQDGKEDK